MPNLSKYSAWAHSAAVAFLSFAAFISLHESYLASHPKLAAASQIVTSVAGLVALYVKAEKTS